MSNRLSQRSRVAPEEKGHFGPILALNLENFPNCFHTPKGQELLNRLPRKAKYVSCPPGSVEFLAQEMPDDIPNEATLGMIHKPFRLVSLDAMPTGFVCQLHYQGGGSLLCQTSTENSWQVPFARAPPEVRVGHSVTFSLAADGNLAVDLEVIQEKAATSSKPASSISKQPSRKLQRSITRFHNADLQERLQMISAAENLLGDLLNAVELDGDAICKLLCRCAGWLHPPGSCEVKSVVATKVATVSRSSDVQNRVRRLVILALSSLDLSDVTTYRAVETALLYILQLLQGKEELLTGNGTSLAIRQWRQLHELLVTAGAQHPRKRKASSLAPEGLKDKAARRLPKDRSIAIEGVFRPNERIRSLPAVFQAPDQVVFRVQDSSPGEKCVETDPRGDGSPLLNAVEKEHFKGSDFFDPDVVLDRFLKEVKRAVDIRKIRYDKRKEEEKHAALEKDSEPVEPEKPLVTEWHTAGAEMPAGILDTDADWAVPAAVAPELDVPVKTDEGEIDDAELGLPPEPVLPTPDWNSDPAKTTQGEIADVELSLPPEPILPTPASRRSEIDDVELGLPPEPVLPTPEWNRDVPVRKGRGLPQGGALMNLSDEDFDIPPPPQLLSPPARPKTGADVPRLPLVMQHAHEPQALLPEVHANAPHDLDDPRYWTYERYQREKSRARMCSSCCSCETFKESQCKLVLLALLLVALSVLALGMSGSFTDRLMMEATYALSGVFFFLGHPHSQQKPAQHRARLGSNPAAAPTPAVCGCEMAPRRAGRCKYVIGLTAALLFRQQCHEAFTGLRAASSPSRVTRSALEEGELPTGDELLEAAEQVREQEVISEVLPKLPDWADFLVGKFLLLMPVAKCSVKYDSEIKKMCKQAITGSKDCKDKETKILEAFRAWDKDKNGFITKDMGNGMHWDGDDLDELSVVLSSLGCSTKAEDLEVMLKEADLDSDGKINYEDWTLSPFESSMSSLE
eukprot:s45_g9.t2